jgi:serine/threonine protein kinase
MRISKRFTFQHSVTGDDPLNDEPWIVVGWNEWGRNSSWIVETEAWVPEDGSHSAPPEDVHLRFLLDQYDIPHDLIPPRSIERTSPAKLERLRDTIRTLGGPTILHSFFQHLRQHGLRITGYLGGGGWGDVFLALRDADDARIALKLPRPPYSPGWRRRFDSEAAILNKLSGASTRVARLVEGVRDYGDLLYLQTEFIDGVALSDIELPLSVRHAFDLICDVLKALDAVHQHDIVHRDLHLGNVIRATNGTVLLDFGVARDEEDIDYYKSFKPVGAMSHCAPEKWLRPSTAGKASDIFSLGVMLYRLVAGAFPFWADTYIGLYEQIKKGAYRPLLSALPRTATKNAASATLPVQLIDLVLKSMLNPKVAKRPPDVAAALNLLSTIEPVLSLWENQQGGRSP